MADPTLRPTSKALRAAGLLPKNQPEHHVATGDSVPPQPWPVSQVFGPVRPAGEKTLIDVATVRYISGPDANDLRRHEEATRYAQPGPAVRVGQYGDKVTRNLVAVVEVSGKGARVQAVRRSLPLIGVGIVAAAWNVYWLLRTVREWRARPR